MSTKSSCSPVLLTLKTTTFTADSGALTEKFYFYSLVFNSFFVLFGGLEFRATQIQVGSKINQNVEKTLVNTGQLLIRFWGGGLRSDKLFQYFGHLWSDFDAFLKQKSINNLEHHLLMELKYEKKLLCGHLEGHDHSPKYYHYSIIRIIKRPLKSSKDVWNTKILNIFNARKHTIEVKTTKNVCFDITRLLCQKEP